MSEQVKNPLPNGDNGRDGKGRFTQGNPGGPGNPHAKATAAWRKVLIECVNEDDLSTVLRVLVENAKNGEPWAIKELLDRTLGRPAQAIVTEHEDGTRGPIGLPIRVEKWKPVVGTGIPEVDRRLFGRDAQH